MHPNTSSTHDLRRELGVLLAGLSEVLEHLHPADLATSHVPPLLELFIELERRAAAGRVLLSAKAAESERWRREGFASPADWLASKQGCGTGRARGDLGTSQRLGKLRDTADALRAGTLSPEQADAITDAASVNPDAETDLIKRAKRESLKNLRDEAARRKAEREDQDEKTKRIHRERRCRTWVGRDGAWNLTARGTTGDGAGFEVEWNRRLNEQFEQGRKAGQHLTRDQYGFDALMTMANPQPTPTSGDTRTPRRENLRHLALIRVDYTALLRGVVETGETCEIAGLGPIPVATARALLGESILKLVITRGSDVANITHLGRGPNTAQQIALLWSQPVCTVEGCNRTARLQNDHRVPFADDKVTRLSNVDPLCKHDHDKKTLHGWALVNGTGRRPMVPPNHPDHPANAPPAGAR